MSADPITGTVKDLGSHCIHITANDLAASGAEPLGVMLTVLLPENVEEPEIRQMMRQAEDTCRELNMEILGGHTEITRVVTQPLISVTGVGKIRKEELLNPSGIRPGMDLVVSKWIGLEATSILAKEREERLKERFSPEFIRTPEALTSICLWFPMPGPRRRRERRPCTTSRRGACSERSGRWPPPGGVGLEIDLRAVPIRQETVEICEFFGVNPYQIMSSGSMMIAAEDGQAVVQGAARTRGSRARWWAGRPRATGPDPAQRGGDPVSGQAAAGRTVPGAGGIKYGIEHCTARAGDPDQHREYRPDLRGGGGQAASHRAPGFPAE